MCRKNISRQGRIGQRGIHYHFFFFCLQKARAWHGKGTKRSVKSVSQQKVSVFSALVKLIEQRRKEPQDAEPIGLEDRRKLGIATLGALKQHPRISAFRRFIEGWYLSYFTPDAARSLPLAGPTEPSQHPWRQSRQRRAIYGARTSTAFSGYAKEDCRENSGHTQDRHGKN